MTRAKFESLAARLDRLNLIVRCLQAFDHCYYGRDVDRAEQDLQAALHSKPNIPFTAAPGSNRNPPDKTTGIPLGKAPSAAEFSP